MAGVPDGLLPHAVTLVRPAVTTDAHGNQVYDYDAEATRTSIRAWLQQDQRREPLSDGRDPLIQRWLLVTNHQDVQGRDRIEWSGPMFEVDGPPEPAYTPGGFHHTEATLRIVEG